MTDISLKLLRTGIKPFDSRLYEDVQLGVVPDKLKNLLYHKMRYPCILTLRDQLKISLIMTNIKDQLHNQTVSLLHLELYEHIHCDLDSSTKAKLHRLLDDKLDEPFGNIIDAMIEVQTQ